MTSLCKRFVIVFAMMALLIVVVFGQQLSQSVDQRSEFVTRSGSSLELSGKPFRYSGPNIEWLGLEA